MFDYIYNNKILILTSILLLGYYLYIYRKKSKHDFWDTQPVPSKEIENKKQGIITKPIYVYVDTQLLHTANNFQWDTIIDINEFKSFLMENYRKDEIYNDIYLHWILNFPFKHINKLKKFKINKWNICLKDNSSIIGTIIGKPILLVINNKIVEGFYVDFLCLNKKYRNQRLAPKLIYKMIEIWKKAKLDIKMKLKYIENTYTYFYEKIKKYKLYQILTLEEFKYYFLPNNNLIHTFITFDNDKINSFITLIEMNYMKNNNNIKTIELLYFFSEPTIQYDLICNIVDKYKKNNYDYLLTLDIMDHNKFFNIFNFEKGHNTYYHLYNYYCNLNKKDIGFVMH